MPTVTFGAVGDIAFYSGIADSLAANGLDWPFARVKGVLGRAQVLFGNFEFPFLPPDFPRAELDPAANLSVVPGPEGSRALREAGFDVLNLAANHILDAGSMGLDYTRACLNEAGIRTGGVGYSPEEARRMEVIERGGLTFGFLCYAEDGNWTLGATNPGPAYYEMEAVLDDVQTHKDEVDILVVSIHGDLEFLPVPAPVRLANSRRIARAGADIILEHHPHVPQGVEMADGAVIAYSLGNFVFGAHTDDYIRRHGPHTAETFVLLVEADRGGVRSFERVPCVIAEPPDERPRPAEGTDLDRLASYYEQLDRWLGDEEFMRETWRRRCKEIFASFIKQAARRDVEAVIEEMVGRSVLVAENRSWMEEILAMARERWASVSACSDPHHRPNYRFQDGRSGDDE
jgi:poly-gamma-glutamate synthesis protein (capsule biosynthesis protein)